MLVMNETDQQKWLDEYNRQYQEQMEQVTEYEGQFFI